MKIISLILLMSFSLSSYGYFSNKLRRSDFNMQEVSVGDQKHEDESTTNKNFRVEAFYDHNAEIELGDLSLENNIAALLADSISMDVNKCSFSICESCAKVEILVERKHADWTYCDGIWLCVTEVLLHVNVYNVDDTLSFSKTISGISEDGHIGLMNKKNSQFAFESALRDAIYKLILERRFLDALERA